MAPINELTVPFVRPPIDESDDRAGNEWLEPRKLFEMDESDDMLGDALERGRMLAVLELGSPDVVSPELIRGPSMGLLFAKLIVFRLFSVLLSALLIALPLRPKAEFELNW